MLKQLKVSMCSAHSLQIIALKIMYKTLERTVATVLWAQCVYSHGFSSTTLPNWSYFEARTGLHTGCRGSYQNLQVIKDAGKNSIMSYLDPCMMHHFFSRLAHRLIVPVAMLSCAPWWCYILYHSPVEGQVWNKVYETLRVGKKLTPIKSQVCEEGR